ncbi:hypothetical protein EDB95_5367 [Dinghuibacter silviterrae]|uniref:Uncharacterized protein n=2 Tax=Dinghuibacter silviterrae TaxID=1539049 RepID=A0A4R8DIX8_9BACT|nr:hypothetical protein EDB95_5367 [Dinghuibacter silviterrae]
MDSRTYIARSGPSRAIASRPASHTGAGPRGKSMPAAPPVQREGDWITALVELAKANPIGTALTIVGGAATILAYYYWQKHPPPKKQVPQQLLEPPDWTTLEGVAKQVKVAPEVLRAGLEEGKGMKGITINDIYKKGFDPSSESLTGVVPPSLLVNLPQQPADKVETLFQRLNQFPFKYTGILESGGSSFLSGNGDCMSLAQRFLLATKAAGVEGVVIQSDPTAMVVASHAIHGRETVANVDGTPLWFFHDHHWGVFQGTKYDLLFMDHQSPQTGHRTAQDVVYNGVNYDTFEGDIAVIHANQFGKLTVALTEGRVGRAMPVSEVKTFIDTHKKV